MPEGPLRLASLYVSPWSERARWVLDHHGLEYETLQHVPFIGERRLRRLVGKGERKVTVPVLILPNGELITESWDIALYADRVGRGAPLIGERTAEVKGFNDLADRTMQAERALLSAALLSTPEALDETLPRNVPAWVRPLLRPVTHYGAAWFARKYDLDLASREQHTSVLRATLERLRAALAQSSPYLLGAFSYADIVMALLLQGVSPVGDRFIRLGPATRRIWTQEALAADFPDLIGWRDELYAKHRAALRPRRAAPRDHAG